MNRRIRLLVVALLALFPAAAIAQVDYFQQCSKAKQIQSLRLLETEVGLLLGMEKKGLVDLKTMFDECSAKTLPPNQQARKIYLQRICDNHNGEGKVLTNRDSFVQRSQKGRAYADRYALGMKEMNYPACAESLKQIFSENWGHQFAVAHQQVIAQCGCSPNVIQKK